MKDRNSEKSTVLRMLWLGLLAIGVMGAIACSSDPEGGESSEGNGNSDNGDSSSSAFVDGEVHDLVMGELTACTLDGEGVVECGFSNVFNDDEEESLAEGGWTEIKASSWTEEDVGLWATKDGENWEGFGRDRLIDEHFDTKPDRQWAQIASARRHSCGIDNDGRIQCWGRQADVSDFIEEAPDGDGWLRLMRYTDPSAGGTFTGAPACAIHADGRLECWGGDGQRADRLTDTIPAGDQWVDAVMGGETICALEEGGNIECWHGLLEPRDWFDTYQEASVEDGTEVRDLAFAGKVLLVVDGQGAIDVWGPEEYSDTGDQNTVMTDVIDGTGFERVEAATVSYRSSRTSGLACALDGEGAMECWGDESLYEDYFP